MAFGCVLVLEESFNYITYIGAKNIFTYNMDIADYLIKCLRNIGFKILLPKNR